jgi:hypothetical protein
MDEYLDGMGLGRVLLQRGLAAIYLLAFLSALQQFRPLLGEQGLLPAPRFLSRRRFFESPSLFHLRYTDTDLARLCWGGIALSLLALSGVSEAGPWWLSFTVWFVLWTFYLSIVNVGQIFYGFGWESMLCEAGFFACFLGPATLAPSWIPMLIFRWMLFRVELGAGLIKIRHDTCWRDCTCLYYHYETQPLPNPLSPYFHRMPKLMHRGAVIFSHFVQLLVPFGLFLPQPHAMVAGTFMILHQLLLIVSGNYAFLNWITIVLGASTFSDDVFRDLVGVPAATFAARPLLHDVVLYVLLGGTALLSIRPTLNFFSRDQLMNYSYNAFHLVNVYGAFGRVTRERYEVILEGTRDTPLGADHEDDGGWRAYEFRGKPGDLEQRPRQIAPYHLRLDWVMWFLPFGAVVDGDDEAVFVLRHERWFLAFARKLLEGDRAALSLLRTNPFPDEPPRLIRARFYRYRYTDAEERARTGAWWKRTLVGDYLPPVSLRDIPDF